MASATRRVTLPVAARWLKRRARGANKGDAGRVLIVAGSKGMSGAAVLCALGAVRSGAGLTRVATVRSQQPVVARRGPLEVTTTALPEDSSGHLPSAAWPVVRKLIASFRPDVIAVGPGLGQTPGVRRLIAGLVAQDVPLVLDADALNVLSTIRSPRFRGPAILTPHPGEMGRLMNRRVPSDDAGRRAVAIRAARRFGATVLLKGAGTVVTDGGPVWQNTTGGPAMATGGTGDVLTGVIAATWAQMGAEGATAVPSAAFGAFVHGLAGDIASQDFPERTLLASDLVAALPAAFKRLWRRRAQGGRE